MCNTLFLQTISSHLPDRVLYDFKSRNELLPDRENLYRDEEVLLDSIDCRDSIVSIESGV